MTGRGARRLGAPALALLLAAGCASGPGPRSTSETRREDDGSMDQIRLERVFADEVSVIEGPTGALRTVVDGVTLYCISDPTHDRMRLVAPVRRTTRLDPRVYQILLQANFHTTLDARYAISDDVVYATYLHPISSLTDDQIRSAVSQVVTLVKTFGTTFSSGQLLFPGSEAGASSDSE